MEFTDGSFEIGCFHNAFLAGALSQGEAYEEKQPHCIPRGYPFKYIGNVPKRRPFLVNSDYTLVDNIFNTSYYRNKCIILGQCLHFRKRFKGEAKL